MLPTPESSQEHFTPEDVEWFKGRAVSPTSGRLIGVRQNKVLRLYLAKPTATAQEVAKALVLSTPYPGYTPLTDGRTLVHNILRRLEILHHIYIPRSEPIWQ